MLLLLTKKESLAQTSLFVLKWIQIILTAKRQDGAISFHPAAFLFVIVCYRNYPYIISVSFSLIRPMSLSLSGISLNSAGSQSAARSSER